MPHPGKLQENAFGNVEFPRDVEQGLAVFDCLAVSFKLAAKGVAVKVAAKSDPKAKLEGELAVKSNLLFGIAWAVGFQRVKAPFFEEREMRSISPLPVCSLVLRVNWLEIRSAYT